ncbi:hypothetical protein Taro_010582 [Colocasia esculenta]|uniref:Uncharacterized protein n=1 Tax=Colocasia esculenta TaxID=4460 RepID=A0A843U3F0_COLES|nr:hypothetical protein [Colocasia esculenta]
MCCCALEAAGSPCVLLGWVSGGESLSVGLGSFQAVGAVGYCNMSVFPFDVSCGESFLLAMLFRSLMQLCCIWPGFGACGGTKCSCPSASCVASRVCSVFEALSFLPLGHFVLAVPCGCSVTAVGWLLCLRSLVDDLLASSSVAVSSWDLCLAAVFLVGLVHAAPVELSTSACVLCAIVGRPVASLRSVTEGDTFVAVSKQWCLETRVFSRAMSCVPALADGPSGGFRKKCLACLCLLGLGSFFGWRGLLESLTLVAVAENNGDIDSSVGRSGVGLQLGWAAVVCGCVLCCDSLASLYLGRWWFCVWALDLVELFLPDLMEVLDVGACVVRLWSHVVAPVFPLCSRFARLTPLLSSGRDSLSQEFVVRRSWWRFVRRALPAV